MKKVLSVALASSMVLGLGANAFALEYNTGANDEASWPDSFNFEGAMFVTDKDGNFVTTSTASLGSKAAADFRPGDVIWMPLYADNQGVFGIRDQQNGATTVAATTKDFIAVNVGEAGVQINAAGQVQPFTYEDTINKVLYWYNGDAPQNANYNGTVPSGYRTTRIITLTPILNGTTQTSFADLYEAGSLGTTINVKASLTLNAKYQSASPDKYYEFTLSNGSTTIIPSSINATTSSGNVAVTYTLTKDEANRLGLPVTGEFKGITVTDSTISKPTSDGAFSGSLATNAIVGTDTTGAVKASVKSGAVVRASLPKVEGQTASDGTVQDGYDVNGNLLVNTVAHGHYTGKIDKDWSINLLEKTKGAEELIDSAEFYRADAADVAMYGGQTKQIEANAVYVKVTLKDFFDSVSDATLKYYVYVADNKTSSNARKTNEVWVEGTYKNDVVNYVNFDWSNNANSPAVWKVKKGENGTAVFDFQDKAFFTVKMYSEEKMYLDMGTAYDKAVAGDFSEADFDSFWKFEGTNANFSREGQLLLASDDEDLFAYEIDSDGNLVPVDAEYVKDYKIAHTNTKVNGYLFNTKELGNYVLSATELEADDEEAPEEEPEDNNNDVVEEPTPDETEKPAPTPEKPNPNTGANDFVGVAVALAVVSVAAAGALALKK